MVVGFFAVLVVTFIAHVVEAIVISLIKKEKYRAWLSGLAGVPYPALRKILICWALAYPLVMWVLMLFAFAFILDKGPDLP